jgi:hypothetical protein
MYQGPTFQTRQVDTQQLRRKSQGVARLASQRDVSDGPTATTPTVEESIEEPDDFYEGRL